jgi:DegV family protein with EDD domain
MSANKHDIAILTDSTANIPTELTQQTDIQIVLQHLIWGTEDLLDLKDISAEQFYTRLPRDPAHPKTSQPPATAFADAIKVTGAKKAVIVAVSSKLSGTYQSAMQAKDLVGDIEVHVVDSRSAGMGLGWQAVAAARARDAGASVQEIIEAADKVRKHGAMVLMVETLEYLHKGGRIGGAQKLIGTALNLKPQLIVNPETGVIEPGERTRTRKKAIEAMIQAFFSRMKKERPLHIVVHHAGVPNDAKEVMERIRSEYKPVEIYMNGLTPVLGTHVGPGAVGIGGYCEP